MFEPWTEKYRPRSLREVVGQGQAVRGLLGWAEEWRRGKPGKPAALLYGPAGTGKTVAAQALARELGWDLIELNASDKRTFEVIKRVAGTAIATGTLFGGAAGKRLVVLDEADNVHGTADRGGYRAIEQVLKQAANPVVLIANDHRALPWTIRRLCVEINFRRLREDSVVKILERVCREEGIKAEPAALTEIAKAARGDARSAINDLQAVASRKRRLELKDVVVSRRDRELSIFEVLRRLVRASSSREARELLWSLDRPPDDAIDWIAENVPRMLKEPADLERVYEALSRADVFLARIRRRQAYKLLGYAGDLMSAGVAVARRGELAYPKFQAPSAGVLMGRTRGVRALRDGVARKVARTCHTSSRVARKHCLPYLAVIFKHDPKAAARIASKLELEESEVEYLSKLA